MTELLQNLIEALREELKQYGEMLALLDSQQHLVAAHRAADFLRSVAQINEQTETIRVTRAEREQRFRHLARTLVLGKIENFKELLPALPIDYRPLIRALVEENNELLQRIEKRARRNHLLVSGNAEATPQSIDGPAPTATLGSYIDFGHAYATPLPPDGFYERIG